MGTEDGREYRIFVDFDSDEIIGCSPYWEPKTMKKRFGHCEDSDDPYVKKLYKQVLIVEEYLRSSEKDLKFFSKLYKKFY